MATAGTKVSNIYELLENILRFADVRELARWLAVSRHWRDVIADSPVLQQSLFLLPRAECLLLGWRPTPQPVPATAFSRVVPFITEDLSMKSKRTVVVAQLHPLLVAEGLDDGFFADKTEIDSDLLYAKELLTNANAPWRNMFVTQPPAHKVQVVSYFTVGESRGMCRATIHNPTGVRLGDIIDKIQKAVDRLEAHSPYKLPVHAEATGDAEALKARFHRSFVKELTFEYTMCAVRGYIPSNSPWVEQGYKNTALLAGMAAK